MVFFLRLKNIDCGYSLEPPRRGCGYSLEPPRRGGSNEYTQSMFLGKYKNRYTPVYLSFFYIKVGSFFYIKVGFKGVYIARTCISDARDLKR